MATSTNPKPTKYRNFYENTGPDVADVQLYIRKKQRPLFFFRHKKTCYSLEGTPAYFTDRFGTVWYVH